MFCPRPLFTTSDMSDCVQRTLGSTVLTQLNDHGTWHGDTPDEDHQPIVPAEVAFEEHRSRQDTQRYAQRRNPEKYPTNGGGDITIVRLVHTASFAIPPCGDCGRESQYKCKHHVTTLDSPSDSLIVQFAATHALLAATYGLSVQVQAMSPKVQDDSGIVVVIQLSCTMSVMSSSNRQHGTDRAFWQRCQ